MFEDFYITKSQVNIFIDRLNLLFNKINNDLPLNGIDKRLIWMLEEYDFLLPLIKKEKK